MYHVYFQYTVYMYNTGESGTNIGTVIAPEKKHFYAIQIKFLQL